MRKFWNTERDNLLRRHYPKGSLDTLAERIGVSVPAVKQRARVLGIRRKVHVKVPWTERQLKYLREHYATASAEEIAPKVKHSLSGIYQKAKELGLEKSPDFTRECGRRTAKHPASIAHRFRKGQEPQNKGKRQEEFMSPEAIEHSKATRFKKGHVPHNAKPIGYERIDEYGYVLAKVSGRKTLVRKHRHVWEQAHGPIPKGYNVSFKDGDRTNCELQNLVLVSRKDAARHQVRSETPAQRAGRIQKSTATRKETIRRDRLRIKYGLKPRTRLVKKCY